MVGPSITVERKIKMSPAPTATATGPSALAKAGDDPLVEIQTQPKSDPSDGC